ncbi:hypothetical protein MTO96_018028 [Rhipicephalus appendiculatus]
MDRMLRDCIVCGIRDDDARRSLLTRRKLTLKEAEDFARASEKAQEDVRDIQETGVGNGSGTMNALQRLRRCEYRPPSSNLESSRPRCRRSDGPHDFNVCRHRNTKCRQCGRKGHLARVCHRSRSRTSGAYVVEEDESESGEFMLALVAHSATDRDVSRPLEKVLTWGGQKLSMIIDTGSPRKRAKPEGLFVVLFSLAAASAPHTILSPSEDGLGEEMPDTWVGSADHFR